MAKVANANRRTIRRRRYRRGVACFQACRPADRRPPWQWCEDHVRNEETSPIPGMWRSAYSPWVRAVMEDFANNDVRDLVVQCAAQTAKTVLGMNCALWAISEDGGSAMWVTATRDEQADFYRDRFGPQVSRCRPVREKLIEEKKTGFKFSSGPFYAAWSGSKARLQSKPIRWLFCDEVRNYPPGRLEMVLKRTRAFWNSRRFLLSTPGKKHDAMDTAFRGGNQQEWQFRCPECEKLQPLKFEQLKWETNETTRPGGRWRFDALADTVRYECAHCGQRIKDTPTERRRISTDGEFVARNPDAPRARISYTWNALLPHWVTWRSVVEEFLEAVDAMRVGGDIEPMYTFVTETLGEPWDLDRWLVTADDYLTERGEDYQLGDKWPLEASRFLAADKQARGGEHYYWVCRAYGPGGASRLVAYGRCNTTTELEEIRKRLDVSPVNSMVDSGFKASEVYRFCMAAGWKPMKGDDAEWFHQADPRTKKTVRSVWRKVAVDPLFGTHGKRRRGSTSRLPLFQWSNPSIKDHLALFTHGVVGQWTLPRKVGKDYLSQVSAEVREIKEDSRGRSKAVWVQKRRDNHYLDCELMIHVAAIITGKLRYSPLQASNLPEPEEG